MAIVKVGTYRNPPEDITDYEAIVSHLEAYTRQIGNQGMILTEWTNTTNAPKIAMGSYISHGGVLYVVEDEDYALPALSNDGTYYIRVAVSGETLAVSYTTNIADYAWNAQYNSLYHPDESQVLHYQVVKNASAIEKYKMLNPWQVDNFAVVDYLGRYHGRGLHVTGAISGASINTGLGDFEIGQDLRVTDSPRFYSRKIGATIKTQATLTRGMWWILLQAFIPAGAEVALYGAYYSTYHSQLIVVSSALKNESTGAIIIYGIATSGDFGQRISTCVEGDDEHMSSSCSISL